jgi:DNA-binding winged helix-turn-helix (wHTH) protein
LEDRLLYAFEGYVLDTARRELRQGATVLAVEPQVFDLLAYLIENRERVVSKDDLRMSVWEGRVVSESTQSYYINAARTVVGDNGEDQRLIRTFPRRGFRFVAPVQRRVMTGHCRSSAPVKLWSLSARRTWCSRYRPASRWRRSP